MLVCCVVLWFCFVMVMIMFPLFCVVYVLLVLVCLLGMCEVWFVVLVWSALLFGVCCVM